MHQHFPQLDYQSSIHTRHIERGNALIVVELTLTQVPHSRDLPRFTIFPGFLLLPSYG